MPTFCITFPSIFFLYKIFRYVTIPEGLTSGSPRNRVEEYFILLNKYTKALSLFKFLFSFTPPPQKKKLTGNSNQKR